MFSEETKKVLSEKLEPKNIKSRSKGKATLSYIESHHAIREANRAFGFDGWSYEITRLEKVSQTTKPAKFGNKENFYVSYIAVVKITCGNIVREDTGFGQGISADEGDSNEGAVKEAVSDAQKRCLRTFGDIFGLALYDKEQKHVGENLSDTQCSRAIDVINGCESYEALKDAFKGLSAAEKQDESILAAAKQRKLEFSQTNKQEAA